ncbi:MAG: diaminopimelate epimerase [Desulfuromonadaceae bacterium]|nr:diaminopimelate epimerase [Desulfuromonadaceae bacterium]
MRFVKMQGIGNDYVYIENLDLVRFDPRGLAIRMSHRQFGIGSDGLILILPSDRADAAMRIFNADGSEAEMCGNGIRCVAKYLYDRRRVTGRELTIETPAGIRTVQVLPDAAGRVAQVTVDMGVPRMERQQIPMLGEPAAQALAVPLQVDDQTFTVHCLSMGNPHCVVFVEEVERFPVAVWGPRIEHHPLFPQRINVEFVQVLSRHEVRQRTWERGAGETLACGTGSSAVTVAGFLSGRTERRIVNHLAGGDLSMDYTEQGRVLMTGPAVEVFEGEWPEPEAADESVAV